MKTSFETRVLRMGLGFFVDINICVIKYYFYLVTSPFLTAERTKFGCVCVFRYSSSDALFYHFIVLVFIIIIIIT